MPKTPNSNRLARYRRGAVVPLIALLTPVLLLLTGFAVDLAFMQKIRGELRLSTDNAARAAAQTLATTGDQAAARDAAMRIAEANPVAGSPLRLRPGDIQFGHSSRDGQGRYVFTAGREPLNAARVNGNRTADSLSGEVPLYFGSLFGRTGFEPETTAVASFDNVDICLVLDRSSSMKTSVDASNGSIDSSNPRYCGAPFDDSRWAVLDSSVRVFADVVRASAAREQVALVTYASDIRDTGWVTICDRMGYRTLDDASIDLDLTSDVAMLEREMDLWRTSNFNGKTHIEQGMRRGIDVLTGSKAEPTASKVMVVMTDGRQNIGDARDAARDCASLGIRCHAVTYGVSADQRVMGDVARIAGGRHLHADTPEQLRDVFRTLTGGSIFLTE